MSFAQNPIQNVFDEQRKKFEEMMKEQKESIEQTKKEQRKIFKEFRRQQNIEFVKVLKEQQWKAYQPESNFLENEPPKPPKIPISEEEKKEKKRDNIQIQVIPRVELPQPKIPDYATPTIARVLVEPQKVKVRQVPKLSLQYLNVDLQVPYPDNFKFNSPKVLNEKVIAEYWQALSEKDYLYFLQQILKLRVEMQLNDWAYYKLLQNIGEQINEKDANLTTLFTWFMLLQSGYNVKIGYESENLYILLPSQTIIYRNTYYRIDGQPFYVLNAPKAQMQIFIYQNNFPEAKLIPNLAIHKEPKIGTDNIKKTLKFKYLTKEYSIDVNYNPNVVRLYENYPLTDMKIYFEGQPTETLATSLEKSLKTLLKGKNEWESVNFLLSFVQKAFEYKTDQAQFNYEKPMFVEEVLHYPFSDCEDRAVLFAYLVRKLVGLEVIGLDYPGHIATAVKFSKEYQGDFVMHKDKKYLICDPTYIGAFAGEAMPDLKNQKIQIIELL